MTAAERVLSVEAELWAAATAKVTMMTKAAAEAAAQPWALSRQGL